jgi:hypothetical protein
MGGACSIHWEMRNVNKILVGALKAKKTLGSVRLRCGDNN